MLRNRKAKLLAGLVVAGTVLATPAIAMAQDAPVFDPAAAVPSAVDGFGLNLLWIVIGAALVIFMQAGFALVETGFCRAKHAAHVVTHEPRHLRPRLRRLLPDRLPAHVRRLQLRCRATFGFDNALGSEPHRQRRAGSSSGRAAGPAPGSTARPRLLPVPSPRSSSTWWPSWTPRPPSPPGRWPSAGSGRAFVVWGLFCGAIYYPLFGAWTWGGGWLAKLGNSHGPGLRLRRLRRFRRRARHGWRRGARRCDRARPPHRQVRQGRQAPGPARPPHPDGHARHVHPAVRLVRLQRRLDLRRDRRAASPWWRPTPASPAAFGGCRLRCSGSWSRTGKPDPA